MRKELTNVKDGLRSTRNMARTILGLAACGLVVLALTGCGSSSASGADSPIVIGTDLPLSGALSGLAQQLLSGYQYAIKQANAKGGVLGRKIELVSKDDQNEPADATNAVRGLITQDHVSALLGSFGSDLAIAGAAVAENYKIPNVQPFASDPTIVSKGYKYVFNLFHLASQIEPVTDQFLTSVVHPKTAAILAINLGWAQTGAEATVKDLQAQGVKIVANESVPTGQSDYTAAMSKIRAANPDVIKLIMYDPDIGVALANAKQLGVKVKAMYVEGDPLVNPIVQKAVGTALEGVFGTPNWYPGSALAEANSLAASYTAATHQPASTEVVKGYQTVQILLAALKKAGGTDSSKLRAALAATNMDTVLGQVSFRSDGQAVSPTVVTQFQGKSLKLVPLWPAQYKKGTYQPPAAF